ncbi:MAG TPA: helix-turn-helix domain-containing protein [Longimicrobium sp.]|nr:helix-turn-helix domain-containing protein [Longimicrobium sp.]
MSKRSYAQYCGLAKALDVVGERWTLLVVRNLLLGPLRYSDLLRGLPGITTNLLAKRLKEMEDHGLLERVRTAGEGGQAYRLTEIGRGLEPVVHALGRWGWQWMGQPGPGEHRSLEWLLVALRRRYRGGVTLTAEIVADDVPYTFRLSEAAADVSRGAAASADVRAAGQGMAFAQLFLGGWPGTGLPDGIRITAGGIGGLHALVEAFERGDPVPGTSGDTESAVDAPV